MVDARGDGWMHGWVEWIRWKGGVKICLGINHIQKSTVFVLVIQLSPPTSPPPPPTSIPHTLASTYVLSHRGFYLSPA